MRGSFDVCPGFPLNRWVAGNGTKLSRRSSTAKLVSIISQMLKCNHFNSMGTVFDSSMKDKLEKRKDSTVRDALDPRSLSKYD